MWSYEENRKKEAERIQIEAAQEKARAAIKARDAQALIEAYAPNPLWAALPWREEGWGLKETLPLPEATRLNWVQGVEALAAMGADPSLPDSNRQGMRELGHAPLAEALSREHWEMAEALLALGAPLAKPSEMMWAASLVAHRAGPARGALALDKMKEYGFDFWAILNAQSSSSFLFSGAVKGGTQEERDVWGERVFAGAERRSASEAHGHFWNYCFSASHAGQDISEALCERWLENGRLCGPDKLLAVEADLLSWGLANSCPTMAGVGARRLAAHGAEGESAAAESLIRASKNSHSEWERVDNAKEFATFAAAWEVLGGAWGKSSKTINQAAENAVERGNAGLLAGLLIKAGADEEKVVGRWRKEVNGRYSNQRETSLVGIALMAKALSDGAEGVGIERLEAYNRSQRPDERLSVSECVAQAESWLLGTAAASPPSIEKRQSMRV